MPRVPLVALALVLPALLLAGCADEPTPRTSLRATATDGFLMTPLDPTGASARTVTGTALLDVDALANTGTVRLSVQEGDDTWDVAWTTFVPDPAKPFHDGGIATEFHEHGDSGVGDTSIPRVWLLAAGWGPATVTRNGQAWPDPVTGAPEWAAHFMVTDTGVFGADRSIRSASGTYDPARAGDGVATPGDVEVHIVLNSNAGERVEHPAIEVGGTAQGLVEADHDAVVPVATAVDVTLFVRPEMEPLPSAALLTLVLLDGAGNEVATLTNQPGQPAEMSVLVEDPVPGSWTLQATGHGVATTYGAVVQPVAPERAQMYFVFESVVVE